MRLVMTLLTMISRMSGLFPLYLMSLACHPVTMMALALFMCLVLTSKLSSWKSIGDFDYRCGLYYGTSRSVLNGSPHWVAHGITDIDGYYFRIVCFDVVDEKFKDVPTPMYEVGCNFFTVGVLDGCLCAIDRRGPESHFDVWVMKEYGVKESWTKLFVVPNVPPNMPGVLFFEYCELLCFTKDGEVVLRLKVEASVPSKEKKLEESLKLVIYNPKQKNKRFGMPQDWKGFDVALYAESLVSPPYCNSTRSCTANCWDTPKWCGCVL
ncbi:F-box/kelch-repeat protein At3g06240-like [Rhododendron vialii]|uniref:F-box/kelch-repeat protein At3g06240-like n=1 Tax=Rhododendron vialii TaxID=182163 RepID=UPI00265FF11A|nr:F-box/kelch-repeat protein At3g06240-like [Rhododendron vialii]